MPVPLMETATGALSCPLVMEKLPDAFPAAVGAKLAVNVKLFPGGRVKGSDAPVTAKPVPLAVA